MTNMIKIHSGFAPVPNGKLFFEETGEGEAIILVHAGIADHTMWDEQVADLAKSYRVISYDLRGYGKSEMASAAFSHYEDLASLCSCLDIKKAHLVGSSMGGASCLDFVLTYPDKVLSLSLVSSAIGGYEFTGPPPEPLMMLFSALGQGNWEEATELAARVWLDGPKRTTDQLDPKLRNQVKTMSSVALKNMNPSAIQPTVLEPAALKRLSEIAVPAQVIVGELDDDSILGIGELLTKYIPQAHKVVVQESAHMLNMEKPALFNHLLLEFLAEA